LTSKMFLHPLDFASFREIFYFCRTPETWLVFDQWVCLLCSLSNTTTLEAKRSPNLCDSQLYNELVAETRGDRSHSEPPSLILSLSIKSNKKAGCNSATDRTQIYGTYWPRQPVQ
jgi:hypothetical protein